MRHILLFTLLLSSALLAQGSRWKRAEPVSQDLHLFHSPYAAMLPTAETLQKGDWEFVVAHRFSPTITEGPDAFWGMDGPATIRLSLGYAVTDKFMLHVGRTNVMDNVEVQLKYKTWERKSDTLPLLLSLQGGAAYNAEIFDPVKNNGRKFQFYGQAILNTMIRNKIGIGVVPTYLYNSHIFCVDPEYSFTLGSYVQYYISSRMSVLTEWNPTISGWRQDFDSLTFGLELETGGHFFKIFLSNNDKVNTTQHIAGANKDFTKGDFRIGFMITRTF